MKQQIQNIIDYLTNEYFSKKHLKALLVLISLFSWSPESEQEVFSFIKNLKEKYTNEN